MAPEAKIYLITDGKSGDLTQLKGVAALLNPAFEIRKIAPRLVFSLTMPWTGADPKDADDVVSGPLRPPFPELAIATGRRAVPYLRLMKKRSPKTFTVFLKDPRIHSSFADMVWMQAHDQPKDAMVFTTLTAPHGISAEQLKHLRTHRDARFAALQNPLAAVLIGGKSRHFGFNHKDESRMVSALAQMAAQGVRLLITTSRRSTPQMQDRLLRFAQEGGHFFWDGTGDNPYAAMLALADTVVVTADSTNMIGEAAATGKQIHIFWPEGHSAKISRFVDALSQQAAVRNFDGALEWNSYPPLNATEEIASEIRRRYEAFRSRVGPLPA
jgi:uncharacterized protein